MGRVTEAGERLVSQERKTRVKDLTPLGRSTMTTIMETERRVGWKVEIKFINLALIVGRQ